MPDDLITLSRTDLGNAIYAAASALLEAVEHGTRRLGNGHHGAQEVTEAALVGADRAAALTRRLASQAPEPAEPVAWALYKGDELRGVLPGPMDPRTVHDAGPPHRYVPLYALPESPGAGGAR